MKGVFKIAKVAFLADIVKKQPENNWEILCRVHSDIVIGDMLIYDSTDENTLEKRLTVVDIVAYQKHLSFLGGGISGSIFLKGASAIELQEKRYFYPVIPGIERISDDLWKVHGTAYTEIKLGDELFFGLYPDIEDVYAPINFDKLVPKLSLVIKDIVIDEEHFSSIKDWQRGFLILQGGNMQEIKDESTLYK